MKKIVFALIFLFLSNIHLIAQNTKTTKNFKRIFLEDRVLEYKGTLLKIDTTNTGGFGFCFYNDLKYLQDDSNRNILYPDNSLFKTDMNKLKNRTFLVQRVIDASGNEITADKKILYTDKVILDLIDTLNKEVLFFKYNIKYHTAFPFLCNLNAPELTNSDIYKKKLSITNDEFTGEITTNNPYDTKGAVIYKYSKKVNGKMTDNFYLSLDACGSTLNVAEKGVIILFDDGSKFEKPNAEIDVDYKGEYCTYKYSCIIPLTKTELLTFSKKKIKKYRLYIYDEELSPEISEDFKQYCGAIRL